MREFPDFGTMPVMQRVVTVLFASLLIAALILLPTLPVSIAQDSTSPPVTPASTGTPVSNGTTATVVGLPFSDTFDTPDTWMADGAWVFDTETAYEGSGWYADGSQREITSTLEYAALINLSGALSAQLIYRHRGSLTPSDFVAIDLSLDGGNSWFLIDQQIGFEAEWDQQIIDLTNYRGQIIRLRFRVSTGTAGNNGIDAEIGYWIDNLSIQYVLAAPTMVFVPEPTGPRTLMGLHIVVGARKEPILDLVRRLREIGWPLGTIKGTNSTEDILNEVARISPETTIVYRSLLTPEGMRDCPNQFNDPVSEAARWIANAQPHWRTVQADYYELMNECWPPIDWMIPFSIESMRLAAAQGQCLLLFSFSVGNPEPHEYARLAPIYEYALQNPCQPGRYHGVALHTYGLDPFTLVSESGIYLGFRHRLFYAQILPSLPEAVQIPVYLTEAGTGDGVVPLSCDLVVRDIIQYTQQLEYDPYIKGFHFWNMGPGGQWVDYTHCLSMIGDALVGYYANRR